MTASPDGFTATILKYVQVSNLQKITCIILRNLFGLYLSHQSCATGTLLLRKKIYPRKYSLNLRQLIFFFMLLIMCSVLGTFDMLSCSWQERQCALQVCLGYGGVSD